MASIELASICIDRWFHDHYTAVVRRTATTGWKCYLTWHTVPMKNMELRKDSWQTFTASLEQASRRKYHWLNDHYTVVVRLTNTDVLKTYLKKI